jgi:hypothetical protein
MSNLKHFPWPDELHEQVSELCNVLDEGSDLACALTGGAFVDHCLGALLQKYLVDGKTAHELLQPGKCLGEFGSRRKMCYSLGLISLPLNTDIELIGHIRNQMVHRFFDVRFSDTEITAWCDKLDASGIIKLSDQPGDSPPLDPRDKFAICVMYSSNQILMACLETEHRERNAPVKNGILHAGGTNL